VEQFPPMPLEAWSGSKDTLHRFAQIVGKVRLAASPRRNHWWNVPFHVTGRGITTRPMGGDPIFTIDFDFVDHRLLVHVVGGHSVSFPLTMHSVATFHGDLFDALDAVGVEVGIREVPFGLPGPAFPDDTEHAQYDPIWVNRYWQVLSTVNLLLEEFASGYSGKSSPVHHFWHGLDIATTRFSDRRVDLPDADSVTREAYSREVISSGFWFGDEAFPEAAFYSYTAPEPPGLAATALRPETAEWTAQRGGSLAVLRYDDARASEDAGAAALEFWESAYQAGARLAGWDVARFASPGGITDPWARSG
jgi:hypothetical protein